MKRNFVRKDASDISGTGRIKQTDSAQNVDVVETQIRRAKCRVTDDLQSIRGVEELRNNAGISNRLMHEPE